MHSMNNIKFVTYIVISSVYHKIDEIISYRSALIYKDLKLLIQWDFSL